MRKEIYHQYANSKKMVKFIDQSAVVLGASGDLSDFYKYVFNIDTAEGIGLDTWGSILNINRSLNLTIDEVEQQYTMSDDEYRLILKLACAKNISDATCQSIYNSLSLIFAKNGNIYVSDLGNMHMRYSFEFLLSDTIYAILRQTKVIPKPAGVDIEIYEMPSRKIFGFNGQELENFDNGTFFQGARQ